MCLVLRETTNTSPCVPALSCTLTNFVSGGRGVAGIVRLQTLLVGEGCSWNCTLTNCAGGGRGVAGIVHLQTLLVGGGV